MPLEDINSNLMITLDIYKDIYIFLCSKVWFVPRLNIDEEIVFHILILERDGIAQRRSECILVERIFC